MKKNDYKITEEVEDQGTVENHAFSLGEHCSKTECHSLDFLPLRCSHCSMFFCAQHAPVQYHGCFSFEDRRQEVPSNPRQSSSSKPILDPVNELIKSHTPQNNLRKNSSINVTKNSTAQRILDSRFPGSMREVRTKVINKKELSPALKLILIKQKAICGDPRKKDGDVPLNDRWFGTLNCNLVVRADPQSTLSLTKEQLEDQALNPKPIWFNKKAVVGKIFDLIKEQFKTQILSSVISSTQEFKMIIIRDLSVIDVTDDCSKPWESIVVDGEDVWLVCYQNV
ncbi:hypothetical protein BY996DRAFT_173103 [Phakopsora pachyrhizi]|uniref:AN1-type domain-containing protein n=1 Tax=Phakopsora pachyrhizi TaxID=170000 RepID=A0AAV0AS07_PHAPC|nr:hypothetical protein BY996DRAFT_173103 [Phakopsora pachyrhizi]CAH7670850.1 hypothetical protein PPACK8108_LOCUS5592 [Phakopsora pachyrhizi]